MNDLETALRDHELVVLRVIGEWWELDLTGSQKEACVQALSETLSQLNMPLELGYLGPEEAGAFEELVQAGGRMPVAAFERNHGEVRLMGPGRLEREEPWLDPVSPAEALWYRGFIFRGFDESDVSELVEYYYLPTELLAHFPERSRSASASDLQVPTRFETVAEPDSFTPAVTDAVDDLTTILAEAQKTPLTGDHHVWLDPLFHNPHPDRRSLLLTLAAESKLLRRTDEGARPARAAVAWLKKGREQQLRDLADAWSSCAWNDLCHTPGLVCDGSGWQNDPIVARATLLDGLPRNGTWLRVADVVGHVKETNPDFQRPDGNYDTWYIRLATSETYITGFDNWDLVEGQLLAFLLQGPMAWLGLTETTVDETLGDLIYRLTPRALDWLEDRPPPSEEFHVPLVVHDDATVTVPFNANRHHRFQVARVAEPEPLKQGKPYLYRLTPPSLSLAREQGIEPPRLLSFLAEASGRPLPPGTVRAVERWGERGTEARLDQVIVLRVRDQEILDKLRASPKTRPYIADSLGDLAAIVRLGEWEQLRQAAARLGLLLEVNADSGPSETAGPDAIR